MSDGKGSPDIPQFFKVDRFRFPPANRCIYCGANNTPLSDEHIIPFSLNGNWILPKASCGDCAKVTQKFEEICTSERNGMLYPLRVAYQMQSRRASTRKTTIKTMIANKEWETSVAEIPIAGFPFWMPTVKLPKATIFDGIVADPGTIPLTIKIAILNKLETITPEVPIKMGSIDVHAFVRMIAKIAYSYAAARDVNATVAMDLPGIIFGRTHWTHIVGGGVEFGEESFHDRNLHQLAMREAIIGNRVFTVVLVHIFAQFRFPIYHVVLGYRDIIE